MEDTGHCFHGILHFFYLLVDHKKINWRTFLWHFSFSTKIFHLPLKMKIPLNWYVSSVLYFNWNNMLRTAHFMGALTSFLLTIKLVFFSTPLPLTSHGGRRSSCQQSLEQMSSTSTKKRNGCHVTSPSFSQPNRHFYHLRGCIAIMRKPTTMTNKGL